MRSEFFAELSPSSVNNYGDQHRRNTEHGCDLRIGESLKKPQGKNFCRTRLEFAERPSKRSPQIGRLVRSFATREIAEFNPTIGLPRSQNVERGVDRRPTKVSFLALQFLGRSRPVQHAQKDRLQNIFGIGCIAGDAIGSTED